MPQSSRMMVTPFARASHASRSDRTGAFTGGACGEPQETHAATASATARRGCRFFMSEGSTLGVARAQRDLLTPRRAPRALRASARLFVENLYRLLDREGPLEPAVERGRIGFTQDALPAGLRDPKPPRLQHLEQCRGLALGFAL